MAKPRIASRATADFSCATDMLSTPNNAVPERLPLGSAQVGKADIARQRPKAQHILLRSFIVSTRTRSCPEKTNIVLPIRLRQGQPPYPPEPGFGHNYPAYAYPSDPASEQWRAGPEPHCTGCFVDPG